MIDSDGLLGLQGLRPGGPLPEGIGGSSISADYRLAWERPRTVAEVAEAEAPGETVIACDGSLIIHKAIGYAAVAVRDGVVLPPKPDKCLPNYLAGGKAGPYRHSTTAEMHAVHFGMLLAREVGARVICTDSAQVLVALRAAQLGYLHGGVCGRPEFPLDAFLLTLRMAARQCAARGRPMRFAQVTHYGPAHNRARAQSKKLVQANANSC